MWCCCVLLLSAGAAYVLMAVWQWSCRAPHIIQSQLVEVLSTVTVL